MIAGKGSSDAYWSPWGFCMRDLAKYSFGMGRPGPVVSFLGRRLVVGASPSPTTVGALRQELDRSPEPLGSLVRWGTLHRDTPQYER